MSRTIDFCKNQNVLSTFFEEIMVFIFLLIVLRCLTRVSNTKSVIWQTISIINILVETGFPCSFVCRIHFLSWIGGTESLWARKNEFFGLLGEFGQIWRWAAAWLGQPFKKRGQNILIFTEINSPWYNHSEKHSHQRRNFFCSYCILPDSV